MNGEVVEAPTIWVDVADVPAWCPGFRRKSSIALGRRRSPAVLICSSSLWSAVPMTIAHNAQISFNKQLTSASHYMALSRNRSMGRTTATATGSGRTKPRELHQGSLSLRPPPPTCGHKDGNEKPEPRVSIASPHSARCAQPESLNRRANAYRLLPWSWTARWCAGTQTRVPSSRTSAHAPDRDHGACTPHVHPDA